MESDFRIEGTRRQVLKGAGAGALTIGAGGLLAACGSGGDSTATEAAGSAGPPQGGTPKRGGTLTVAMIGGGESETIDPEIAVSYPDILRTNQLFNCLFEIGDEEEPVPALATEAEPNGDATKWTVHLRQGVTWHDGKPLTAADLASAIKRWASPENYGSYVIGSLLDAAGVRAVGNSVVEVPFHKGVADFKGLSSFYNFAITREDSLAGGKAIGTGPFKFESFTPGKNSVMSANADYWADNGPYVASLVIDSSFTEETARLNAVLAGTVDVLPFLPSSLAAANSGNDQMYVGAASGNNFMYFPCRVDQKPFSDRRVMQALKLLVNRPQMVESVYSGYATETNDLPGQGLPDWATPSALPVLDYDPEKAKSLLKAAGYEDLSVTLNTSATTTGMVESATLYAQQAKAGGVTVKVQKVNPAIYYTEQGPEGGYLSYPMLTQSSGGGSAAPCLTLIYLANMWTEAPYSDTHFGNPTDDALLFDAVGETNPAKAREKWEAVQKIQYDRGGQVGVGYPQYLDAYSKRVRSIGTTPGGWVDNFKIYPAWIES